MLEINFATAAQNIRSPLSMAQSYLKKTYMYKIMKRRYNIQK